MSRQENIKALLKKHGYKSINQFCINNNLIQTNENKRIKHDELNVDIDILFNYANILHEPIDTIIKAFYEEKYIDNQKHVKM